MVKIPFQGIRPDEGFQIRGCCDPRDNIPRGDGVEMYNKGPLDGQGACAIAEFPQFESLVITPMTSLPCTQLREEIQVSFWYQLTRLQSRPDQCTP